MAVAPPSEQEFIARLKSRDESALEDLLAQYEAKVFGLALRLTGNRQDAEEVLQDVLWTVVQKIGAFRGGSKLSTWIYRIATNAALMKLRKQPKIQVIPLEEELGPAMDDEGHLAEPVPDRSGLPSDEAERHELAQRIEEAINRLPTDYRSAFVLRDVEGFSAEEACAILDISVGALKSRLHRARLFLRKQLADYATARQSVLNPGQRHA